LMRIRFFLPSIAVAHAASLTGKVVGVTDGDTITVLTAAKSVKVRLHGIGAGNRSEETRAADSERTKHQSHLGV